MSRHLEEKHPGIHVSAEFAKEFEITTEELVNLRVLNKGKPSESRKVNAHGVIANLRLQIAAIGMLQTETHRRKLVGNRD